MKNLLKSILIATIAIVALGCTKEPSESNTLSAPKFTATANENTIIITWEAVTGAAYYEVKLDDMDAQRTDKLVHKFEDLQWDKTYTVALRSVSADEQATPSSMWEKKSVTIGKRAVPAYREWYPQNNSAATAISNNGRWVVGGNDRQGMIIDLTTDELKMVDAFEFYDVDDNGVAIGSYHGESPDGVAAMYIDGNIVKIDLSNITENNSCSSLVGITPDGTYAVGWLWEYDTASYYAGIYGMIVPFCYDIIKDKITVPEAPERIYNERDAVQPTNVTPEREIFGCEQSNNMMMNILWKDEYTPYGYIHFNYDAEYNPISLFGDTENQISQNGKWTYGIYKTFENGYDSGQPAAYCRETDTIHLFSGVGSVTAMTDDGIAFINDVPAYMGTTSFVVDTTLGEPYDMLYLEEWLLNAHDIDLKSFEPTCDTEPDNTLVMDGVITIATSADGRKLVGITNTNYGWMTYVIDLDGVAAAN